MAGSANRGGPVTAKGNFSVSVRGFILGYWKTAKIPETKIKKTTITPAGAGGPTHFPSGLQDGYDDAEFTHYQDTAGQMEAAVRIWLKQCADIRTGRATVKPLAAKRDATVQQHDIDGTVIHEWTLIGTFPTSSGGIELEGGDENAVEKALKLSVDDVIQVR